MSSREFTDRRGTKWRVMEITPQFAERRKADRRVSSGALPPSLSPRVERRSVERRRVSALRATVSSGYEQGWLTFESAGEKRRLAPVPQGWQDFSLERLELLCRLAQPVEQRHGRAVE